MAGTKSTTAAATSAVSMKIPRRSYNVAARIAKREQRTLTTTIERAIEFYSLATDEGKKTPGLGLYPEPERRKSS